MKNIHYLFLKMMKYTRQSVEFTHITMEMVNYTLSITMQIKMDTGLMLQDLKSIIYNI